MDAKYAAELKGFVVGEEDVAKERRQRKRELAREADQRALREELAADDQDLHRQLDQERVSPCFR